jgi:WD40 repeat protein
VVVWDAFRPLGGGTERGNSVATPGPEVAAAGTVPEGRLLVRTGSELALVPSGRSEATRLAPADYLDYTLSPDGTTVAGRLARREASGLFRPFALVLIDTSTGLREVLHEAGPQEAFGAPVIWSPDGQRLAYIGAEWGRDVTHGAFPGGEPRVQYPCVIAVDGSSTTCYPELDPVLSIAWSPDGGSLWLESGFSIQVLDVATRDVSIVVPENGGPQVLQALEQLGFAGVESVQFVHPAPSNSGEYIAAVALFEATAGRSMSVPMIFDAADGSLRATGMPNPDLSQSAWSPTKDVFAYSTGVVGISRPGDPALGVRLLRPSGEDQLLVSTADIPNIEGKSDPFILRLKWSPSGEWLAIGGREQITIVGADGGSVQTVDPFEPFQDSEFLDWGT